MSETDYIGNILVDADEENHRDEIGTLRRPGSAPPYVVDRLPSTPEVVDPQDPRLDPAYFHYYYSQRPLNPRLPPPLLSWRQVALLQQQPPQQQQQQQQQQPQQQQLQGVPRRRSKFESQPLEEEEQLPESYYNSINNNNNIDDGNHAINGDYWGENNFGNSERIIKRSSLVERIQNDFPRTPSPVFMNSVNTANITANGNVNGNGVNNKGDGRFGELLVQQENQQQQQHSPMFYPANISSDPMAGFLQQKMQNLSLSDSNHSSPQHHPHHMEERQHQHQHQHHINQNRQRVYKQQSLSHSEFGGTGRITPTQQIYETMATPLAGLEFQQPPPGGELMGYAPMGFYPTTTAAFLPPHLFPTPPFGQPVVMNTFGAPHKDTRKMFYPAPHHAQQPIVFDEYYQMPTVHNHGHSGGNPRRGGHNGGKYREGRGDRGHGSPMLSSHSIGLDNNMDSTSAPRSKLMEEFRASKNKKFELEDIVGHVVEFSRDQHGSRFIQQKLETATNAQKDLVFREVLPEALDLMTDVFGNYVIQKLFEHGLQSHQKQLAQVLHGHVLALTLQTYGCRVIQKALEVITPDEQACIAEELEGHVMRCVQDQNGNHVIQKCIEKWGNAVVHQNKSHNSVESGSIGFIVDSFKGNIPVLAVHSYGCRVIQRILEHCPENMTRPILEEIVEGINDLVEDQYGNYVVQHVLENGNPRYRGMIIQQIKGRITQYSQHKFASNVVERCFQYGTRKERQEILDEILNAGKKPDINNPPPLYHMMKDQFANYVVQKMIDLADDNQRKQLIEAIKPHIPTLRRYTYGKHIISRIEKLTGGKSLN